MDDISKKQLPSVGRIVHWVNPRTNEHLAAIVTWVYEPDTIDCTVFARPRDAIHSAMVMRGHIEYSEQHVAGTWHWPEKV